MLKRITAMLLMIAALSAHAIAGPEVPTTVPQTAAGRQFTAWLDAFNAMDDGIFADFINTHSPALVKYIQDDYDFSVLVGGFRVERVLASDAINLSVLVSEPYSDQLSTMTFEVEPASPHRIVSWDIRPAQRPADMGIDRLDEKHLIAGLDSNLQRQAAEQRFSGTVLLAKGDRILYERAFGLSDAAGKQANAVGTRFTVASMGKMFTAVAILQLAESGKLDLQQPLGTYLPDYPNRAIADNVTLHHLLTHTGGTGDIFVDEIEANAASITEPADYIAVLGKRAPDFKPGEKWDYSNYGFVLLGRVVEVVSGEPYFDYLREHIYRPAGMMNTGSSALSAVTEAITANGYRRDGGAWVAVDTAGLPRRASPAGGEVSTAHDMYLFARALQTGTLLSETSLEILTRGKVAMRGGQYAYGFKDQERSGVRYVGHGGGAPGANTELDIYPAQGYIAVVLTNQDPPGANRIAEYIGNRIPSED